MLWIASVGVIVGCACAFRPHVDIRVRQGIVRGYRVNSNPPFYEFLGIPYAGAPVKANRFTPPLPPPKWDGIFEATHKICCPQPSGKKCDENCLVLNIFVPVERGPYPVVVHVHDGDYNTGCGATSPPSRLISDFIVITFNYRLGALGFLCMEERNEGNFGLQDQAAAIDWVHRNINNFNGDVTKITVIGSGSAAMSIHLLLTTTALDALVHRVVIEAAVAISPLSLTYDAFAIAKLALNMENDTVTKEVFKKYKSAKTNMLVKSIAEFNMTNRDEMFRPCVLQDDGIDTNALVKDPMMALMDGHMYNVPIMIIYSNKKHMTSNTTKITINDLPENLQFPDDVNSKVIHLINDYYFGDSMWHNNDRKQQMLKYVNDINAYPILKAATLHAKHSAELVFVMEHANNAIGESMFNYLHSNEAHEEDMHADRFVTLFTNFALYGDPTPLTSVQVPLVWAPISPMAHLSTLMVLHFSDALTMRRPAGHKSMDFWDKMYMTFYKSHIHIDNGPNEEDFVNFNA